MSLEFLKGWGWILKEEAPKKCSYCGETIDPPFFICREFDIGFCIKCELSLPKRPCKSQELEHEHFKIVEIKLEIKQ